MKDYSRITFKRPIHHWRVPPFAAFELTTSIIACLCLTVALYLYVNGSLVWHRPWMDTVETPQGRLGIGWYNQTYQEQSFPQLFVVPRVCLESSLQIRPDCMPQAILLPIGGNLNGSERQPQ